MRGQGFTLIELLIVLVLIGVMTGMAVLAIGHDGKDRLLAIEAKRLAELLDLAEQEALLRGEAMALELFEQSYRFLNLTESGWQVETRDMSFRVRELDSNVRLNLRIDTVAQPLKSRSVVAQQAQPQILLTPDGNSERIEITLSDQHQSVMQISNTAEQGWQAVEVDTGHD